MVYAACFEVDFERYISKVLWQTNTQMLGDGGVVME